MNVIKQTKKILQILGIGIFAAGLGLKAQTASAEDQSSGVAASEAASALILTGSIAPARISKFDEKTSLSPTRLEKVDLGAFAFSSPRQRDPEPFVLKPGFIAEDGQKTKPVNFSSLDHFLVSLTEQNRGATMNAHDYAPAFQSTHQGYLPGVSKSNLLNSRFANLVMKNLTGIK